MIAIILGIVLIVGGLGWAVMGVMAAGMADRSVTPWEEWQGPIIGGGVVLFGISILIWG